jgi:predicted secreted protein
MTFTKEQQYLHRDLFIKECRQKAWGASCHADWVSQGLDRITADYAKLQEEDATLETDIETLETAPDSHSKDNRDKRKAAQERRDTIAKGEKILAANVQQGQQALNGLYQSIEASLQLATHAEKWEWKDVEAVRPVSL